MLFELDIFEINVMSDTIRTTARRPVTTGQQHPTRTARRARRRNGSRFPLPSTVTGYLLLVTAFITITHTAKRRNDDDCAALHIT